LIRPDSVGFDDIDVLDSVRNKDIIEKNFRFLEDEVFG
jgi:transposase